MNLKFDNMKLYTDVQVKLLMVEAYKAGATDVNEGVIKADTDMVKHVVDRIYQILEKRNDS